MTTPTHSHKAWTDEGGHVRLIKDRLTYGRRIPWRTNKRERKRGRDITWTLRAMPAPEWVVEQCPGSATIIDVRNHGSCGCRPIDETRYYVSSLLTGAKALLRQRGSIENSWHGVSEVPLREDAHRYREENGVQILATLRSLAINALRLKGIWSITEGMPPWLTTSRACSDRWGVVGGGFQSLSSAPARAFARDTEIIAHA